MATASLIDFPLAIPVFATDEAAWLENRRTFIGASESATILGVGYKGSSPLAIWHEKVNGVPAFEGNDLRLRIGKKKEPLIRELFAEQTGLPCEVPAAASYRSRSIPFMGASLDAATLDGDHGPCPVELKNVGSHNARDWETDEPPLKFAVQVQHQLAVLDAPVGYLCGLIADERLQVYEIARDDTFIAALVEHLRQFWRAVETKTMPDVDASEATAAALATLYPRDSGGIIALPFEALALVANRESAAERIKAAEAEKLAADNQLKAWLGENTKGVLADGRCVTWKTQETKGYTVGPKISRVLRVSKEK